MIGEEVPIILAVAVEFAFWEPTGPAKLFNEALAWRSLIKLLNC
jgi:hypothetical protein